MAFTAGSLAVLYVLRGLLHLSLIAATSVGSEAVLLLRFLITDRWVFGQHRPTWKRLWQFHVASAGGGIIWWIVANLLPRFGIHYLLAAIAATACSVFVSMVSNFLWIWRKQHRSERVVIQSAMLESIPPCRPTDGIESPTSG